MNNFYIKLIALITMLIDHTGCILFPSDKYYILRVIGRCAFPLYAFLISEGAYYTKNIKNYMKRLAFFAISIEIFYILICSNLEEIYFENKNVFFTLYFGVLSIYLNNILNNKLIFYIYFSIILILSYILKPDYSFLGVLLIYFFYKIKLNNKNIKLRKLKETILILIFSLINYLPNNIYNFQFFLGAFASIIPIIFYNEKLGYKLKWLFYLFYPLHFLILIIIKYLLYKKYIL